MATEVTGEKKKEKLELNDLPNEIKALIVARIADIDEAIDDGRIDWKPTKEGDNEQGWETEDEEDSASDREDETVEVESQKRMVRHQHTFDGNLRSIAAVTKEFRDLAVPRIYQRIELDDLSLEDMLFCLEEIMPKYARHVREFSFSMSNEEPELSCELAHDVEENGQVIKNSLPLKRRLEAVLGVKLDLDHECNTHERDEQPITTGTLQARSLLISRMLQQCDRITRIERDYTQRDFLDDRIVPNPRLDQMIDLVIETKFANQLTDYVIDSSESPAQLTDAHMIRHLSTLRSLHTLELLEPISSTGLLSKLADTIAGLPDLTDLSVSEQIFVNHYFAHKAEWKCSLRVLRLATCSELTVSDLEKLVSRFKDTLTTLELEDTPLEAAQTGRMDYSEPADRPVVRFDLPHLEVFSLAAMYGSKGFLDGISSCKKLREIRIDDLPYLQFDDFQAFLDEHAQSLERVVVRADVFTLGQEEILEQFCVSKGIDFEVDASSDLDGEDEEDDYYDEDEEGYGDDYPTDDDDYGFDDDGDDAESATYSDI